MLALCLVSVPALAAQDHAAAPMKAEPTKPLTREEVRQQEAAESGRTLPEVTIIDRFQESSAAGMPRMAVFWNRDFDDQVSDWMSSHRHVVTSQGQLSGQVPEGELALEAEASSAVQGESRTMGTAERPDAPAFALQSGMVNQFARAGISVVDRAAIMRITDDALEDGSFSRLSPDQARLEMRALAEHADLLLVLEQVAESQFHIRVLDVQDGSLRAMVKSTGEPPADTSDRPWVASEGGFEKAPRRKVSLDQVGRELALQTLMGMTTE